MTQHIRRNISRLLFCCLKFQTSLRSQACSDSVIGSSSTVHILFHLNIVLFHRKNIFRCDKKRNDRSTIVRVMSKWPLTKHTDRTRHQWIEIMIENNKSKRFLMFKSKEFSLVDESSCETDIFNASQRHLKVFKFKWICQCFRQTSRTLNKTKWLKQTALLSCAKNFRWFRVFSFENSTFDLTQRIHSSQANHRRKFPIEVNRQPRDVECAIISLQKSQT